MKIVNGRQSIAAALCTLLLATGASAPTPGDAQVVTKVLEFEPETLTILAGTKVTWTVSDRIAHTVTTGTFTLGGNGLRTSQNPDGRIDLPLTKAHEVSYTFSTPGTYSYYCTLHQGMTGHIIVTP